MRACIASIVLSGTCRCWAGSTAVDNVGDAVGAAFGVEGVEAAEGVAEVVEEDTGFKIRLPSTSDK
jgi:hypothetical protein